MQRNSVSGVRLDLGLILVGIGGSTDCCWLLVLHIQYSLKIVLRNGG
jgi:hypothetical protein